MQENLLNVEKKMRGLTDEDLLQPPTLPKRPVAPKKGLSAAVGAVGVGIFLLLLVFLKQLWVTSSTFEPHQRRLDAIKRKYGLGR